MKAQRRERHGNREQGPENRDQELGFVILNEVTHSVLRKNLNLCQQEAYNVLCALLRSGDNTPFELKLVTVFAVLQGEMFVRAKPPFCRERGSSRSGEAIFS